MSADTTISINLWDLLPGAKNGSRIDEFAGDTNTSVYGKLPVGFEINSRYRILEAIGRGSMGSVYRVADALHRDRKTAVKFLRSQSLRSELIGLFQAEFQVLSRFKHPNVASVYDFGQLSGASEYFFSMEFVDGNDLLKATEELDLSTILEYVVQVCRCLSYVHSRNVIHFDLKPANIFVTFDGDVKILDFGLSGIRARTRFDRVVGTPGYIAPEISGARSVDHRVDLYALGVLIYQIICRKLPFSVSDFVDDMKNSSKRSVDFDIESRQRVPKWLRDIISRLCASEPDMRYRTANEVIEAINKYGNYEFEIETDATAHSYVMSSRFVGREKQYDELLEWIANRCGTKKTKSPFIGFIRGTSGIGKSRLAREIRQQCQLSGLSFVEENCYENSISEFQPISNFLDKAVRIAIAAGEESVLSEFGPDLIRMNSSLDKLLKTESSPSNEDPHAERIRLIDRIGEFIVRIAEHNPLVFHLDDLQWAGQGTIDLLINLHRMVKQRETEKHQIALVILCSFRDDEVEGMPIGCLTSILEPSTDTKVIELDHLKDSVVHDMLLSMFGQDVLTIEILESITTKSWGNPFFIEELALSLVESGVLGLTGGSWVVVNDVNKMILPATIHDVLIRRISGFDKDSREILNALAVCGKPKSMKIVLEVTSMEQNIFHRKLIELKQRNMVVQDRHAKNIISIKHDQIREILYSEMRDCDRELLHGLIGNAIENSGYGDRENRIIDMAYHYVRSKDEKKACEYSRQASLIAKRKFENHAGIEFCHNAISRVPTDSRGTPFWYELKEDLADMYTLVGKYQESEQIFNTLLADSVSDGMTARVYRKLGRVDFDRGNLTQAIDKMWKATEILGGRRPFSRVSFELYQLISLAGHLVKKSFRIDFFWKKMKPYAGNIRNLARRT